MEKLWSLYENPIKNYDLVISEDFKTLTNEKLWRAAYGYNPEILVWGNGKSDLINNSIKSNEYSFDLFLFMLKMLGNSHEQFVYARQVTAHRIIESLHSFLILLKEEKYSSLGGLLRIVLESIAIFDKLLRKTEFKISKIEKSLSKVINQRRNENTNELNWSYLLEAQNLSVELENDITKIITESYVDWPQYISDGNLQKYKVKEGLFNPSPQMGYSEAITKMETRLEPHKGGSWGMLYIFLCDFTHPSVGSRLNGLDVNSTKIHKDNEVWTREIHFSSIPVENELISNLKKDLVYFSYDLIKLYLDINERFEKNHIRVKDTSQLLVRNTLFYNDQKDLKLFRMLKKKLDPYNKCICFGTSNFKFCCGNKTNW